MSDRKETILSTALRLFAERGYETTPTSLIAKEAGVSEGLVFRHFENKEGLLAAILAEGQTRIKTLADRIERETDPKRVLALTIDLPMTLLAEEREFWSLQTALKFRSQQAALLKNQINYFGNLPTIIAQAFSALGYENPARETELLMLLLEGFGTALMLSGETMNGEETVQFIKSKYEIMARG
jgi:AcrR family transcriptional regulator